jgi:hypothetical protein
MSDRPFPEHLKPGYQISLAAAEQYDLFRGPFPSKYYGRCRRCREQILPGDPIYWALNFGAMCAPCYDRTPTPPAQPAPPVEAPAADPAHQEETPMPAVLPRDDYAGPVLPGQRWQQRGVAGHSTDIATVLRYNGHTVQIVYEGGGRGLAAGRAGSHKSGKRYGVPEENFRRNYVLVSQPPGVKEEDLLPPVAPDTTPIPEEEDDDDEAPLREPIIITIDTATNQIVDTPAPGAERAPSLLDRYFESRRRAREFVNRIEGQDARDFTSAITPAPTPDIAAPLLDVPAPPTTPTVEEPVTALPLPAEPTPILVPVTEGASPGYSEIAQAEAVAALRDTPEPAEVAPAKEVDPLDAFLDTGRALVERLTAELAVMLAERGETKAKLDALDQSIAGLERRRDKTEAAVEAAVAAILGVSEEPAPEPTAEVVVEVQGTEPVELPPVGQPTAPVEEPRHRGPDLQPRQRNPSGGKPGVKAKPGDGSQSAWVLDRLVKAGAVHVGSMADEFGVHYGLPRHAAIKNISSILGYQVKHPKSGWPPAVNVGKGTYRVAGH